MTYNKQTVYIISSIACCVILMVSLLVYFSKQSVQLNSFVASADKTIFQLHDMRLIMLKLKCECNSLNETLPHLETFKKRCDKSFFKLQKLEKLVDLPDKNIVQLHAAAQQWSGVYKKSDYIKTHYDIIAETPLDGRLKTHSLSIVYQQLLDDISTEQDIRNVKKILRSINAISRDLDQLINKLEIVADTARKQSEAYTLMDTSGLVILLVTLVLLGIVLFLKVNQLNLSLKNQVAERLQTETALRSSEENLRITWNSIGDAVIATDIDGVITQINPVAQQILECQSANVLGKTLSSIYKPLDHKTFKLAENPINVVLKTGEMVIPADYKMLNTCDNESVYISESAAPIKNSKGELLGSVLVFRNITNIVKMEEQLHHSHKMDSIGQLAGGIAHDFNNMLGGIIGAAELLTMKLKGDSKLIKYADIILNASQRAASLTQQLLDFSRKGRAYSVALDVHKACNHAIDILRHSIDKRIIIDTHLEAEVHTLNGDFAQIQNVFLNIGLNARDAMPDGGTLSIHTKNLTVDKSWLRKNQHGLEQGEYIRIDIEDTGVGFDAGVKKRIFEPFFTTKSEGKGTGLGLAAAYGTVLSHKGHISVESQIDKGTCFRIYLPVIKKLEAVDSDFALAPGVKGGCVLLVDDEEIVREMGAEMLNELGYNVILAKDGQEGFELFQQHVDRITLVILDVIMPVMNGRDCFWKIRDIKPNTRVLMSSGYTKDAKMELVQEQSGVAFLKKPYMMDELKQAIDNLIQN